MPSAETPRSIAKNIGRRIAELRAARGLSQEQFSDRLGVSLRYFQSLEAGEQTSLGLPSLVKIARALHVQVAALFEVSGLSSAQRGRPRSGASTAKAKQKKS